MLRKLPLGAFVLLALLLVAFRSIIRKRKMRPQLNNNPFALIQPVQKRNWKGQVGKTPDGFLTFQTVVDGVRAGFINLFQTGLSLFMVIQVKANYILTWSVSLRPLHQIRF